MILGRSSWDEIWVFGTLVLRVVNVLVVEEFYE